MCGIAGILGFRREVAEPALAKMLAAMRHRGPDGEGTGFFSSAAHAHPASLAHARLAIIEPSVDGAQPMVDGVTGNVITFNGEIYNYRELREELRGAVSPFRTKTDTEVILRAYERWGADAAHELRGMFAFCLLDPKKGVAWLCWDRMGIKPLYVVRVKGGGLLFASEVRTLLAAPEELVPRRVSPAAIESFLAQGMVCGLDSIVSGIELVAPGESLLVKWDGREQRRWSYWKIPFEEGTNGHRASSSRGVAVEELSSTLKTAVDQHLVADVPLGVSLSGGVDSTAIATVASGGLKGPLHTIAIGFDQRGFDETKEAEESAHALGTQHLTHSLRGADMLADIDQVVAAMDQPTIDGFNTYFVSRAARHHGLTVALSGVGGDELFGGYATFRDVPRAQRLARLAERWRMRGGLRLLAGTLARALRARGRGAVKLEEVARRPAELVSMYLLRRELFLPRERRALSALPPTSDSHSGLDEEVLRALSESMPLNDSANAVASFELKSYMRDMLLRDADVFSMAVGLELRVPLLDHRLVETACMLPGRWKRPIPRPKPLLIDAVGARLPKGVLTRPKRGFTFPWDSWLRGPLREKVGAIVHAHEVWAALAVSPTEVVKLWERFLAHDPRAGAHQMLALWVLADFTARHRLRVG